MCMRLFNIFTYTWWTVITDPQGEFVSGKMHGYGVLTVHNSDKYQGEFANNLFHGHGIYEYGKLCSNTAYQTVLNGWICLM